MCDESDAVVDNANKRQVQFAEQEVDFAAHWLAGTCQLDLPEDVVEDTPERYVTTRYVPLGVVVGIVPWNCEFLRNKIAMSSVNLTISSSLDAPLWKACSSGHGRKLHHY